MVVRVAYGALEETVKRVLSDPAVFVVPTTNGSFVCGIDRAGSVQVVAQSRLRPQETLAELQQKGIDAIQAEGIEGIALGQESPQIFVAAVSYRSHESTPGLWLEVFANEPTKVSVLRAVYDEFCETGELENTTLEEFIENVHPNVVILSPGQMQRFLDAKS